MGKILFIQNGVRELDGLMSISSYVKKRGHTTELIVDGKDEPLKEFLIRYGLRLIWTSHSLDSLGDAIEPGEGPFVWDDNERRKMRAELDAAIAKVYGLTEEEYSYILDTFTILRNKDTADFGEYKTKRETLEAFNRIRIEVKK